MKKIQKRRSLKPFAALLLAIIVVSGFFIWLDKAYDRLQENWLARDSDVVYPERMREDFRTIISEVKYFETAEGTMSVTGGFEKWFSITGYKDNIGPNLTFRPANACITFDNYFNEQDVNGMLDDLYRIGFTPDRYSPSRDIIIKDLSGEKAETTDELAPSHRFERGDRNLRVITPFKTSEGMATGFACLSEN